MKLLSGLLLVTWARDATAVHAVIEPLPPSSAPKKHKQIHANVDHSLGLNREKAEEHRQEEIDFILKKGKYPHEGDLKDAENVIVPSMSSSSISSSSSKVPKGGTKSEYMTPTDELLKEYLEMSDDILRGKTSKAMKDFYAEAGMTAPTETPDGDRSKSAEDVVAPSVSPITSSTSVPSSKPDDTSNVIEPNNMTAPPLFIVPTSNENKEVRSLSVSAFEYALESAETLVPTDYNIVLLEITGTVFHDLYHDFFEMKTDTGFHEAEVKGLSVLSPTLVSFDVQLSFDENSTVPEIDQLEEIARQQLAQDSEFAVIYLERLAAYGAKFSTTTSARYISSHDELSEALANQNASATDSGGASSGKRFAAPLAAATGMFMLSAFFVYRSKQGKSSKLDPNENLMKHNRENDIEVATVSSNTYRTSVFSEDGFQDGSVYEEYKKTKGRNTKDTSLKAMDELDEVSLGSSGSDSVSTTSRSSKSDYSISTNRTVPAIKLDQEVKPVWATRSSLKDNPATTVQKIKSKQLLSLSSPVEAKEKSTVDPEPEHALKTTYASLEKIAPPLLSKSSVTKLQTVDANRSVPAVKLDREVKPVRATRSSLKDDTASTVQESTSKQDLQSTVDPEPEHALKTTYASLKTIECPLVSKISETKLQSKQTSIKENEDDPTETCSSQTNTTNSDDTKRSVPAVKLDQEVKPAWATRASSQDNIATVVQESKSERVLSFASKLEATNESMANPEPEHVLKTTYVSLKTIEPTLASESGETKLFQTKNGSATENQKDLAEQCPSQPNTMIAENYETDSNLIRGDDAVLHDQTFSLLDTTDTQSEIDAVSPKKPPVKSKISLAERDSSPEDGKPSVQSGVPTFSTDLPLESTSTARSEHKVADGKASELPVESVQSTGMPLEPEETGDTTPSSASDDGGPAWLKTKLKPVKTKTDRSDEDTTLTTTTMTKGAEPEWLAKFKQMGLEEQN